MMESVQILRHYLAARYRPQANSRAALEGWQDRRFQAFANSVLVRSLYYAPFVGKPLSDYPLADKATMVAHFDQMNTRGLKRDDIMAMAGAAEQSRDFRAMLGDISVGLSSGTSGSRGLFAVSPAERQLYVGTALAKLLPSSLLAPQRIALLLRANNTLYESAAKARRIAYRFFDLVQPVDVICRDLSAYKPTIIIGPPQALRLLADARQAGHLDIAPLRILAAAEVLDDLDREVIEGAFVQKVHQIYQATEGFLGATCRFGRLHLNEDYIHFEPRWIDDRRFMPIVTDFTRSTQPIIRYRLDDILVVSQSPCPCGSVHRAIDRIEGRFDDILALPSQSGVRMVAVMPDFIRDAMGHVQDLIQDYRVIQLATDRIELRLTTDSPAAALAVATEKLSHVFARFNVRLPQIDFAGSIMPAGLAKVRRVERRFSMRSEELWPTS